MNEHHDKIDVDTELHFDEVILFENKHGRNDRFKYAKARQGNDWYFLKAARSRELEGNLKREQAWSVFMDHVVEKYPDAKLRGPKLYGFQDDGSLAIEYIDAPLVAFSNDADAWRKKLDRYVDVLVTLDHAADGWQMPDLKYNPRALSSAEEIDAVWRRWLGDNYDNVEHLEEAREIVVKSLPTMTFRYQHGDLTPWQIFEAGDEWVIFDGENAGDYLPRYNDLAYGYGRLFSKLKDKTTAAGLLKKFIEKSGVKREEFEAAFMPVMLFRGIGMIGDAHVDKERNYLDFANDLLTRCLSGKLSSLEQIS